MIRARETGEGCFLEIAQSRRGGVDGLVPQRDLEGLRASRGRGHRQQGRQLRAPCAGHRRHARRRPLPDLRVRRRRTSCSWPRSRSSGRTSARASAAWTCSSAGPARSSPTTPRATSSCARELRRDLPDEDDRASGSSGPASINTTIAPVNTPRDARRRPAVPGPPRLHAPRDASAPRCCRTR